MFAFCKPISSKKRFLPFRELNADFTFSLFDKAQQIPTKEWDAISEQKTIFLERDYLQIVERCEYTQLMCRYVIVYHKKKACGIIYFQIADFKAEVFGELLSQQVETIKSKRLHLFEKYMDASKHDIILRLFTCGNNLVSGEYGYVFDKKIKEEQANELLLSIVDLVSKEEKLRGTISAVLIKDFRESLKPAQLFKEEKYSEFFVEPNLIVTIPKNVTSVSDYIDLFSKKYRNRAKSIFKSFANVETKHLSLDEIILHEKEIYALYEQIFENAKFKLIKLPADYFSSVKRIYETRFSVKAFFYEGKIIAFGSCFLMPNGCLEAHYIGFNYELNNQFNLYQNLLYSVITEAIQHNISKVNLGRTAAEIKTTVGAKAQNLICYIKPQNTISKLIQKPFIAYLQPAEWIPRNPFKEESAVTVEQNMIK
jgi:hypothetical protein